MAEKQTKTETPVAKYLPGGVTQLELDKWKKDHGQINKITVSLPDGLSLTCYLRPFSKRAEYASALSFYQQNKLMEAGEVALRNCWLGGDEAIKTDEKAWAAASMQAFSCMEFYPATTEKI